MLYRYLGNTGMRVSVLSWGNWINTRDDKLTEDSVKCALEHGVNFFDTAEVYGFGEGEKSLGLAFKNLKVEREKIVVSTKIFASELTNVNSKFMSRKHIIEGLTNSLKRLQLDYVDIVFSHRFDSYTSMEDVCRAFNWLINNNKAFYWGTSEWDPSQIMQAMVICEKLNLIKPVVEQCQYNMFVRDRMEKGLKYIFREYNLATTTWSPLHSGVLTGKYIEGIPKDSRFDLSMDSAGIHFRNYNANKKNWDEKLLALKEIATGLGISLAQLALTWVIKNPDTTTCLVGASKVSQLEENFKCIQYLDLLTSEVEAKIETILGNRPDAEINFRDFKPFLPTRVESISRGDKMK